MSFLLNRILLTCMLVASLAIVLVSAGSSEWTDGAHATYYTDPPGGACGYEDVSNGGFGSDTTALSDALFNNGLTCGACYQVECKFHQQSACYSGESIFVTATNNCPQGSTGGWCNDSKLHFDLSPAAFNQLAPTDVGVIPIQFKRVSCTRQGGIRFSITGNPWFINVLVYNVGGGGDVQAMSIQADSDSYLSMWHNWGQNWSANSNMVGFTLTFQVVLGNGHSMEFKNIVDSSWSFGQTYEANSNF